MVNNLNKELLAETNASTKLQKLIRISGMETLFRTEYQKICIKEEYLNFDVVMAIRTARIQRCMSLLPFHIRVQRTQRPVYATSKLSLDPAGIVLRSGCWTAGVPHRVSGWPIPGGCRTLRVEMRFFFGFSNNHREATGQSA